MAQYLCPERCEHWTTYPFRHLIITSVTDHKVKSQVWETRSVFVICANCRHSVLSVHPRCRCVSGCHSETRSKLLPDSPKV